MYTLIYDYIELCETKEFTGFQDEKIIQDIPLSNTEDKYICLTYDDGPHPEYTPQILDTLKENEAQATFFLFGKFAEQYPSIVQRILSENHEIGNHTYSHPTLTTLDLTEIEQEILAGEEAIRKSVNYRCNLFRPPYGIFANEIVEKVMAINYKFVLWSREMQVDDWKLPGSEKMVEEILNKAKSGSIVLMHDAGGNRDQTVEATRKVIPLLKGMGYKLITISDLIKAHEHS
ncbi:polysaccharide deacetylase family protein [Paenibacillus paeoniae]|uniref:NodB homology domain-containing protein n=1 Tax=Paenibacillus paeoniae TaxID=2292705 RepID=A0A371NZQ6_9BACL|nr:polysaccharide deacetylase family protein [Paenibacillus paeoniae]REK69101.1 hypothetical protein DX130_26095 [Paenibacillus paeoniae]